MFRNKITLIRSNNEAIYNMKINEIYVIIVKVVSGILIPIYILLFINLFKFKKNLFILIGLLFNITCMLMSIAYLLITNNSTLCTIQSSIFVFGDLSKIALAIGFIILAYSTFIDPMGIEQHRILYFTLVLFFCQILPLIYGIVCGIFFDSAGAPDFCFITSPSIVFISSILRYLFLFFFYLITFIFLVYFKRTFKEQTKEDFYILFIKKMKRYTFLLSFTLVISLSYTIMDNINFNSPKIKDLLYGIVNICDGILTPLYVFIFLLDKRRYEELKKMIFCQKNVEDDERISELDLLMEII